MLKQIILRYTPSFILEWLKSVRKGQRRKYLKQQQEKNSVITKEQLKLDLQKIGLRKGDSVLVHSSLSKIGFVENGAQALVDALAEVVGNEGNLLFPTFPAAGRNKTYLESDPLFDILNTPSRMGSV